MYVPEGTQGDSTIRAVAEGTSDEASFESGCSDFDAGSALGRCFTGACTKALLRGTSTGPRSGRDGLLNKVICNPRAR